jgi:two-component system phosphate regulon response regulator OmpR
MSRILLLDDDPSAPSIVQRYLASLNHQVTSTLSVLGALAWLDRHEFDLLVIDIPANSQTQALALCRVLKSDPKTITTRVLMIGETSDLKAKAVAVGTDAFLKKPYTLAEISTSIADIERMGRSRQPVLSGMTVRDAIKAYSVGMSGWARGSM